MVKPIYKNDSFRHALLELYQSKLEALQVDYVEEFVNTDYGSTHVLILGKQTYPPVILIHGVTACAPIALEPIKELASRFRIFAIDCVGAPNPSAQTRMSMHNDSYGRWLTQVMDGLHLDQAPFIAASYGAFILQRFIAHNPSRIAAAIFVVPAGFANGGLFRTLFQVLLPLMKFYRTKKKADLIHFLRAFFSEVDNFWISWQKNCLLGINMDLRKPPLLTKKEARGFAGPVYMLAVDDDVFFPAEKGINRCKRLFVGFKESVTLKQSKHVPSQEHFPQIERQVGKWLDALQSK